MTQLGRRSLLAGSIALGLTACGKGGDSGSASSTSSSGGAGSSGASPASSTASSPTTTAPAQLPGGGTTLFPRYRLFGWCGTPAGPALGQLGIGSLDTQVKAMLAQAPTWAGGREVMPVIELIATIVHPKPGADGKFRSRVDDATLDTWSAKAKESGALLLINIQPGLAEFIDEARYYERWLREPHVGLALDPEWKIDPGQIPGRAFGHTTGADVDKVSAYLAQLCQTHHLPQKALVVHVLRSYIFEKESQLKPRPEVAVVKSVDGIGVPKDKVGTYHGVMAGTPSYIRPGFKIFFTEDKDAGGPLMTAPEVLGLKPQPDYVMFE